MKIGLKIEYMRCEGWDQDEDQDQDSNLSVRTRPRQ